MIELQQDLTYQEHPSRILDQSERKTGNKTTKFRKTRTRKWSINLANSEDEATWEREDRLREEYPDLFPSAT